MKQELQVDVLKLSDVRKRLLLAVRVLTAIAGVLISFHIFTGVDMGYWLKALISAASAATLICFEILLTAKVRRQSFESVAVYRFLYFDWLMAGKNSIAYKHTFGEDNEEAIVKSADDDIIDLTGEEIEIINPEPDEDTESDT